MKSQRLLKRFGVVEALGRGEPLVMVGPTYELVKDPGIRVRLVFLTDDEHRLCVGSASDEGGAWHAVEWEPFSMRTLGYYERRLKRIGTYLDPRDAGKHG